MDKMATIGDDKDKEESKDTAAASPSGNHEEQLQLHENSEEMTPNEDDNNTSKVNNNGSEERISACVENEAAASVEESGDVTNGDQDEFIESGDSRGEPGDDKDVMPGHPSAGKRVKVKSGELAGVTAPVKVVKSRGCVVLDHPDATIDVAAHRCEFLDEISLEELKKYDNGLGRSPRITPSMREQICRSGAWRKRSREVRSEEGYESESKKRNANPQINDIYSHSGLRLSEMSDAAQTAFSRPSGHMSGSAHAAMNVQTRERGMLNYEAADRPQRVPRPLPPILLEATKEHELPPSLRHLDPNAKVDIFNRKTGKIMSGEQAIQVKDLPEALLLHSEYEPIVQPLASRNDSIFTREGRSARNIRVSNSIAPQSRLEVSPYKGRSVVVIKGSYRGYIGVIDECTPGGWYVLKDVHRGAELGFLLVVGPDHVELIATSCEETITEMSDLVKNYNFQNMVTIYQDYLTQHFNDLLQPLMDLIRTLSVEEDYLNHALYRCQSETDVCSRSPEEVERIRSRQRTVRELKLAAEKERKELLEQCASARAFALHTFKEEEKVEASKKLSFMQLDADTNDCEPAPKPICLPEVVLAPPYV